MSENLRKKTFDGMVWSYIQRFGGQAMQLVTSMVLTRILLPEDYGLLAMAAIFSGLAMAVADSGFSSALIQKKDADQLDYTTVYWMNILLCLLVYGVLFAAAPFVADFFEDDRVGAIVRVSSLGLVIGSIGAVHNTILTKELIYKPIVIRNLIMQGVSAVFGITLALNAFGVWAIVYQGLLSSVLTVVTVWWISPFRPSMAFSVERLRGLWKFGSKMLGIGLIDAFFLKLNDIFIGKVFKSRDLALYLRADSTRSIFQDTFLGVLNGLLFPVFSKMQNDDERLIRNNIRFMTISSMLIFTVMLVLVVLAEPLFTLMFSSRWNEAIPYFQLFCISGLFQPLHAVNLSLLKAKGRSDLLLKGNILLRVLVIVPLIFAYIGGLMWLYYARIVMNIVNLIINISFTNKVIAFPIHKQLSILIPYLLGAIVVAGVTLCVDLLLQWGLPDFSLNSSLSSVWYDRLLSQLNNLIRLSVGVGVALLSFVLYHRIARNAAYYEGVQFVEDAVGKKRIFNLLVKRTAPVVIQNNEPGLNV